MRTARIGEPAWFTLLSQLQRTIDLQLLNLDSPVIDEDTLVLASLAVQCRMEINNETSL